MMRNSLVWLVISTGVVCLAEDLDLKEYARQCDEAIENMTVLDFNCADGTILPIDRTADGKCRTPPYLPDAGCWPNSRIGELVSTDNVGIVYLCRHKRDAGKHDNTWDDIAVIQTNYLTGATCFYQQLDDEGKLDGMVKAPSTGDDTWLTPKMMALADRTHDGHDNACVQCHDNGALLRTPYVMQANEDMTIFQKYRKSRPGELRKRYWFPGGEFLFWEKGKNWNGSVFSVTTEGGGLCKSCHEMGVSALDDEFGTATWLGPLSSGQEPTPHMTGAAGPHGDEAFWMKLKLNAPAQQSKEASRAISECAKHALGADCNKIPFQGQIEALSGLAERALARPTARVP